MVSCIGCTGMGKYQLWHKPSEHSQWLCGGVPAGFVTGRKADCEAIRMKTQDSAIFATLGQDLQVLTLSCLSFTHLNIIELMTCDLYKKN